MRYVLLIYQDEKAAAKVSPADMQKEGAAYEAFTRSIKPARISAASTLRPVGLIRSPIITNGRSTETTTSFERERSTVSISRDLQRSHAD